MIETELFNYDSENNRYAEEMRALAAEMHFGESEEMKRLRGEILALPDFESAVPQISEYRELAEAVVDQLDNTQRPAAQFGLMLVIVALYVELGFSELDEYIESELEDAGIADNLPKELLSKDLQVRLGLE